MLHESPYNKLEITISHGDESDCMGKIFIKVPVYPDGTCLTSPSRGRPLNVLVRPKIKTKEIISD